MKQIPKKRIEELKAWIIKIANKPNQDTESIHALTDLYEILTRYDANTLLLKALKKQFQQDIRFRTIVNPPKGRTIRLKKGDYNAN